MNKKPYIIQLWKYHLGITFVKYSLAEKGSIPDIRIEYFKAHRKECSFASCLVKNVLVRYFLCKEENVCCLTCSSGTY